MDSLLEPLPRLRFSMAEQHRARGDLADEIEQFVAIRVRGEIEILHFATARHLARAGAENKALAVLRRLEPPARSIGVRVTDEENRLPRVAAHPHGQVVRGGVL